MGKRGLISIHITLFLLAAMIRLGYMQAFGGLDEILHDSLADQFIHIDLAENLTQGRGFAVSTDTWIADAGEPTSIRPPAYPLFLAFSFTVFGQSLVAVRAIQALLSALLANTALAIGRRAFSAKIGVVAGLATAVYPPLVMYVRPIMSESLFYPLLAVLVWTTYCLLQSSKPGLGYFALWGASAGIGILTRSEVSLLVGLLLAYLVYHQVSGKEGISKSGLAIAIAAGAAILSPYVLYNYFTHGRLSFLPNSKWALWDHTYWVEMRTRPEWQGTILPERKIVPNWEELTEFERDEYLFQMSIDFIQRNPEIFLVQRVKHLARAYPLFPREWFREYIRPDGYEFGPTSLDDNVRYVTPAELVRVWAFRVVAVFASFGILLGLRKPSTRVYPLVLTLFWNLSHVVLVSAKERARLQIDFCLILFAASAIVNLAPQVVRTGQQLFSTYAGDRTHILSPG